MAAHQCVVGLLLHLPPPPRVPSLVVAATCREPYRAWCCSDKTTKKSEESHLGCDWRKIGPPLNTKNEHKDWATHGHRSSTGTKSDMSSR
jgi:hypothetical protein